MDDDQRHEVDITDHDDDDIPPPWAVMVGAFLLVTGLTALLHILVVLFEWHR